MWTPWSLIGKEFASNAGESESSSVMSGFLRPQTLYSPWNSLGQNTGVGSLSLLQGTFPTQKLNRGLLRCRRILYQLSRQGSPYAALVDSSSWLYRILLSGCVTVYFYVFLWIDNLCSGLFSCCYRKCCFEYSCHVCVHSARLL